MSARRPTEHEPGAPPPPDAPDEPFVVPIEDVLDLHTFQPKEVLAIVDAYLDAALERGLREVRLIHGRGKGVQRAHVQQLLANDPRVERFEDAAAHRGGWGATVAWLVAPASRGESRA